jgi:hypothetical protein
MISILSGCAEYRPGTKEVMYQNKAGMNVTIEIEQDKITERRYDDKNDLMWSVEYNRDLKYDGYFRRYDQDYFKRYENGVLIEERLDGDKIDEGYHIFKARIYKGR